MLELITPLIMTRDEEANLERTLRQLQWARDVVVVDSFSTDATPEIARGFPNVRLFRREIDTIAEQWNYGLAQIHTPWALALDADYFVPDELAAELARLAPPPGIHAYRASFRYAVGGKPLRASLYPAREVLLHRDHCTFWQDGHTQRVRVEGETGALETPIIHDDRKPFRRFLERQRRYMQLEAEKLRTADPRTLNLAARVRKLVVVAPFAVLVHTLFVRRLILDGWPGLRYAWERFVAELMLSRALLGARRRSLAERLFVALGRTAAYLPHIRGKTRLCLATYKLLGLGRRHLRVQAQLRRPVRYVAELDLHAWLQRVAFLTGGYEADTVAFLLRLHAAAPDRGFLLDVGANIGLITLPFALSLPHHSGTRVVAVEAVPDNVAALRRNIELNQLGDVVHVIPAGLGDVAGTVDIQVEGDLQAGEGTGTANILPAGSTYECVRQTLTIRTLDELADSGEISPGCSVVKIDTDGYDLKVLQGGVNFLQRDRPVIFGEFAAHCMNWHKQTLRDVLTFAKANGYEVLMRTPRTWTFEPATEEAPFSEDLLWIPGERREHYRFCMRRG